VHACDHLDEREKTKSITQAQSNSVALNLAAAAAAAAWEERFEMFLGDTNKQIDI